METLQIELEAFFDYGLSQFLFEESFEILQHRSYTNDSICLYTDCGNLPTYDIEDVTPVVKDNKSNRTIIAREIKNSNYGEYDTIKKVLEDFLDIEDMLEYIGFFDEESYDDKVCFLDNLGVTYKDDFIEFGTIGGSQGDYSLVYVNKVDFERELGVKLEGEVEDNLKTEIDRLFWNSPISGSLYIAFEKDGKEFSYEICLSEILDDIYDLEFNFENIFKKIGVELGDKEREQIREIVSEFDIYSVETLC